MPRSLKRWDESCLFTRLLTAEQAGEPLHLSPGDVSRIVSILDELEVKRASTFDVLSAQGFCRRQAQKTST